MFIKHLVVLLGLAYLLQPTLSAPLNAPTQFLKKRLTEPVCQEKNGVSPSYNQVSIVIKAFALNTSATGQTSLSIPPSGFSRQGPDGVAVGFSSKPGTTESLDLSVGSIMAYWRTIQNQCQVDGETAGFQGINEDPKYWAWVNV